MMEMSDSIAALSAALAKAQAEIGKALKDSVNPAFKSKYADYASTWDAWQAHGPANGLAIVQPPGSCVNGVASLTTLLSHSSGEYIRETMTMPVSKNDAHGVGSAITYLRRYSLSAFTGIAPDDDDDGNLAVQASTAPMKAAFPEGPCKNKTALDTAITAFCTHIAALTTSDDLEAFVTEQHPTLAQYRAAYGRDSEHVAAISKQLADARARVAARAELPADAEPLQLDAPHVWPETVTRLVRQVDTRETAKALKAWWELEATASLVATLDTPSLLYVKNAYRDRLTAIKAMDTVTA